MATIGPLKLIIDRPSHMLETLECGHTIARPLGLGENAFKPSKVKRRRCYICGENAQQQCEVAAKE